jgi:hypothetical protein
MSPVQPTFIPAIVAARRRRIVRKFEEAGADQPGRARTLESLGVHDTHLASRLIRSGVLATADGERYYLSAEGVARWNRRRNTYVLIALALTVSILACVLLLRGR